MRKFTLFLMSLILSVGAATAQTANFDFADPATLDPAVTPSATASTGVEWDDVTFSNNGVTLNINKGGASTKVRLWTNKDLSTELRTYKNSTITVTAPVGAKLTEVVFEGGKVSTMTATGFSDGTWTGNAETVVFSVTNTLNVLSINVKVLVDGAATVAAPVASVESGVYTTAQSVTFASEYANAENPVINYYYTTNGDEPTQESTLLEGALEVAESCTVKIIAVMTVGEEVYVSEVATYDYIISEAISYVAATTVDQIVAGNFIIVADGKAAVAKEANYGYLPTRDVTVVDAALEDAAYYAFTLEVAEGGWYIKDNAGKYLYMTGSYNSFNMSDEVPAEGGVWSIAVAEGVATITNVAMNKYVQYTSYGTYGAYTEAQEGSIVPAIFVPYVEPAPEPEDNVVPVYQVKAKDTKRGVLYASAEDTHLTHCGATYSNYHNLDIAVNAEDVNQQFIFVEHEGVTYLYSLGAKKFAVKDGQFIKMTANPEGFVTVEDSDVEGYKLIKFNGENRLNFSGGYEYGCVANYETPDDGNRLLLVEVGTLDVTELVASIDAYLKAEAEALATARAAFDAKYAEAAAILAEANLSVVENELALQTKDANAAYFLWSNHPEPNEGSIDYLVDGGMGEYGGANDFFHTQWSNPVPQDTHYIEVDLGEGNLLSEFSFAYSTRNFGGASDFPDAIQVMGSNDKENYTEVYSVTSGLPQSGAKSWKSDIVSSETAYRYFRFNVTAERIYWHMSEFDIVTSDVTVADKYADVANAVVALNNLYESVANNENYDAAALNAAVAALEAAIAAVQPEVVAPLEIVSVTPSAPVDVLDVVTVEFSDEIEGTYDIMSMTQIYLGSRGNGCSFSIEGNVLTVTPFYPITAAGEYALVIPEGLITRKSDGSAVVITKENAVVFTVAEPEPEYATEEAIEALRANTEIADALLTEAGYSATSTVVTPIDIASNADAMLYSNAPCTNTQWGDEFKSWSVLFDGNSETIFHSEYDNGSGLTSVDGLDHYIRVDLGEGNELSQFKFTFTTRSKNCQVNSPTTIVVEGSNDAEGEYTEIATITDIPQENSYTYNSEVLGGVDAPAYRYIRYRVTATGSNQTDGGNKVFFFISEFGMSKVAVEAAPTVSEEYAESLDLYVALAAANEAAKVVLAEEKPLAESVATVNTALEAAIAAVQPEVVAPLEIVSVTPSAPVDVLDVVTVEFSDEIEGTYDIMSMTQIYLGSRSNGCSFSVEGKVLTVTPFYPITAAGEYALVIPEGLITRKSDGSAVVITKENAVVFTVAEAVAPLEIVSVTPSAPVDVLDVVTVEFSDEIEGTYDIMSMTQIYLGSRSNGCSFSIEGNVLTVTPFYPITAAGEYALVIPEGLITRKSDGSAVVITKENAVVFTVAEAVAPETFALEAFIFPAVEGELKEIKGIRVDANQGASLSAIPTEWTFTDDKGNSYEMNIQWLYDFQTILIMINPAITEAGTYTLNIPEGSLTTEDGKICEAATFSWTIEADEPEIPAIDLEKTYRIKSVSQNKYLNVEAYNMSNTSGPKGSVGLADLADTGDQIFHIEDAGNGNYYFKSCNGHYIVCRQWNVDACDNGEKSVLGIEFQENNQFYILNGANYFKVGEVDGEFGVYYPYCDAPQSIAELWVLEEAEFTDGISNVVIDENSIIYDLTGRKVDTISGKGIYIVNGKKVLVK